MRPVAAGCSAMILLTLCGCAATRDARPLGVGNGAGSQYGNYAAEIDGETTGPAGDRCVVVNWDRPLTKDLAIRLRSASCPSPERPGTMIGRELSRTVIPIAESTLKDEP